MYGTVARFRLKPGMESRLVEQIQEFERLKVPGAVGVSIYRMDADPSEYSIAVVFESKEAYFANANSPEQDARYRRMLELLQGEPEWHDGEIVYATAPAPVR
ncbi:MAG: antibiotic biosynthesis monooxygenase [Chloroflexi bacterium]|nr:antibiotic biosynthesis monooxygenase [Chloroflexota bacterium]